MTGLLDSLAASGMLPVIAFAALAIEAVLFLVFLRGRPALLTSLLFNAASGAALMGALWAGLKGAGGAAIAGFLAASFVAHCCDLWVRLRQ